MDLKQRCDREARRFLDQGGVVSVENLSALLYSVARPLQDDLRDARHGKIAARAGAAALALLLSVPALAGGPSIITEGGIKPTKSPTLAHHQPCQSPRPIWSGVWAFLGHLFRWRG